MKSLVAKLSVIILIFCKIFSVQLNGQLTIDRSKRMMYNKFADKEQIFDYLL